MPNILLAGFWGFVAGAALILGALVGYYARVPRKLIAAIMGFGSGVLISALAFDLMEEASEQGGLLAAAIGFLSGAAVYTVLSWMLSRRGARHRKRAGREQPSEAQHPGSGMAIALGALIDGIPESMVIGLTLLRGGSVSTVAVVAIFLSNIPEGLSSAAGMKNAGRSGGYVLGVWTTITVLSAVAAVVGYGAFAGASAAVVGAVTATAAGAMLAMIVDTMVPEAVEVTHGFTGIVAVAGFLCAFLLSRLGG